MELLDKGFELIAKMFNKSKALQEFTTDFVDATVEWISPLFLKDEKLKKAFEEENLTPKLEGRLETKIENLLKENTEFKQQLEQMLQQMNNSRATTSIDNSINVNAQNAQIRGDLTGRDKIQHGNNFSNISAGRDFIGSIRGNYEKHEHIHAPDPKTLLKVDDETSHTSELSIIGIRKIVGQGKTKKATRLLTELVYQDNRFKGERTTAILLSARWNSLEEAIIQGTADYQGSKSSQTAINHAILKTLENMEEEL